MDVTAVASIEVRGGDVCFCEAGSAFCGVFGKGVSAFFAFACLLTWFLSLPRLVVVLPIPTPN